SAGNNIFRGLAGNDTIDGGAGIDTVDYSTDFRYGTFVFMNGANGVIVNLGAGTATDGFGDTDTLSNIENVIGTNFADTITGSSADNTLTGGGGNDTLSGLDGINTIDGGTGWDTATYQIASNLATITHNVDGSWTIAGSGFTDTLTNVEMAHFTN